MGRTTGSLVTGLVVLLLSFANTFAQDVIIQQGDVDAAEGTGIFKKLVVDSNVLVVDEVNDRVGIGTDSPDSSLHILSDANHIKLENGPYSAVIELLEPVPGIVDSALYLKPSRGKIRCSADYNSEISVESSGEGYLARFGLISTWEDPNYDMWLLDNRGKHDTPNYRFSILHKSESNTKECLTILPDSGDVGIGTNTPSKKLDVDGDANIDGSLTVDELVLPTSAPGSAVAGSIYFDTSVGKVKVYDGSNWETLAFE